MPRVVPRAATLLMALLWGGLAWAQEPGRDPVRAGVLPGWREGGTHRAAIVLHLEPGWHTYWRAPGEWGLAPALDLSGSRGLGGASIRWPSPRVIESFGHPVLGYRETVVLPLDLVAAEPGGAIALRGRLSLGVCREVCVPATATLAADLPAGGEADGRIVAALAAAPDDLDGSARCEWGAGPQGPRLRVTIEVPPLGVREWGVIEWGEPRRAATEAATRREGGALIVEGTLAGAAAISRGEVTVTAAGEDRAVTLEGCPP